MTDETEIRRLLKGGQRHEAFERIVMAYGEKAFHLAVSFLREENAARDMAQEALLRLWKALPAYDGRASVSTWLYAITRNVCLTELRRLSRKPTVPLEPTTGEGWEQPVIGEDPGQGMDVEAALARLQEKYSQVLRLFYLEQRSYEETARLLDVPLGTMKTLLFRARKAAADLVSRQESCWTLPLKETQ